MGVDVFTAHHGRAYYIKHHPYFSDHLSEFFFKTGAFGKGNVFIGFDNYRKLFSDGTVWQALWNTCKYAVVEVPFSIAIALVLAVFLNGKIRGRSIWRTIYFLPMVAAPAAVAMVWRWLYNSEFGLFNHLLRGIGLSGVNWISNPNIAFISVAIVGIWSVIGYNMVLFFLQAFRKYPETIMRRRRLTEQTGSASFFYDYTALNITHHVFFVTVTRVIGAMQVFDSIYMMMGRSNPALVKTQSLVYLFYKYSFIEGNKGYGSSIVMLLLMVILLITMIQMICQKKWVNYS